MIRYISVAALLAIGATFAIAQGVGGDAAIKERREVMGLLVKAGADAFKMSKGEAPFDLAKVQATLKANQELAPKLKGLFPENSKTGDTEASALIWQNKPEFEAAIDRYIAISKAGASAIKDEATFKAEYPKVLRGCNECHKRENGFAPGLSQSFKRLKQ